MEADELEFKPHSAKQNVAIWSPKPIVVCATGIQWGKTRVGAVKGMMVMHKFCRPDDNFLILAPTYKIMQQSTLPAFLSVMQGLGTFSKVDGVFKIHGGGTCYFRTATDPDSIVGVTNVRFIWGDEAGLYSLYFWENMQARAAFKQAQIVLTTSPYTLNWIYKELIRPIMKEGPEARPDVELIRAKSIENPYFPLEYYEAKRKTMDTRRFEMMFGGEWNKFQGLVYDCFDEFETTCDPFPLPKGTEVYAGVDWGTTHPFVIHVRAITPDKMHYQIAEHYETGKTITDFIEIAKRFKALYQIQTFYCDPASPGYIAEFNRAGLTAVGADNDIRLGIDMHYDLIKSKRFKVFRGMCPHSVDEYEMYRYPDDDDQAGPNKDVKERTPVKQWDHAMDAGRYCTRHTYRHETIKPVIITDSSPKVKVAESPHEFMQKLRNPTPKTWETWE